MLSAGAKQPLFRFHPNALEDGESFESSQEICDVCGQECRWRYSGVVYTVKSSPIVCYRCISDGRLEKWFGSEHFELQETDFTESPTPEFEQEILHRTPGIATYNSFEWPVINGEPLAYIGRGDEKELWREPEIQAAMAEAWRTIDPDDPCEGPNTHLMIFRSLNGKSYKASIDFC